MPRAPSPALALPDCRQHFAAQTPTAGQMKLVYPLRCDVLAAGKLPVATLPPACLGSNKPRVRKTFIACSKPKPQVHAKQPAAQSSVSCVKGTRCGCKLGVCRMHSDLHDASIARGQSQPRWPNSRGNETVNLKMSAGHVLMGAAVSVHEGHASGHSHGCSAYCSWMLF